MRNHGKPWSPQDDDDLRRLYPTNEIRALMQIFGRAEKSIAARAHRLGLTKAEGYEPPRRGMFESGLVPWNKGKPHPTRGRAVETQFKKGRKPHTWVPIGHERVSRDGILERKVQDATHPKDNFRSVHSLIWEEHHGPIPEGHIVRFKDGNKRNFDLDNLELVTRAENMHRNSVHRLPKELAELVQLRGALNRKLNNRMKA